MDLDFESSLLQAKVLRNNKCKLSQSQFGLMVDYMLLNPELVNGRKLIATREEYERKWEELAALLNSDGTGPQKSVDRWKKSWGDVRSNIKKKGERINRDKQLAGCGTKYIVGLNELEQKAFNLIKSSNHYKRRNKINVEEIVAAATSKFPQPFEGARYILVNTNSSPVNVNSGSVESSSNIVFGMGASPKEECTSNNPEQSRTTDDIHEILNDVPENPEAVDDSRIESEHEHRNVSEVSAVSHASTEARANSEIFLMNQSDSDDQNSNYTNPERSRAEKFKTAKRRKKDGGVLQLLQRQTDLLEYIAVSISRIEEKLDSNSSHHAQSKDAIGNIGQNIDKIAGSLGSVSKSLKKMAES